MQNQRKAVYFLSDAHLGSEPDPERRSGMLVELLRKLGPRATHLYLLGDLFDFWFEYRHAVPKGHFRILRALADLVDAGTEAVYLGGNHDFWCGSYLSREVGLIVHQRPIQVTHQGRRIFLAHGDGVGPGDTGYRLLKALLRNRVAIALYRWIHPDLGVPLAHAVSRTSRVQTKSRAFFLQRFARHVVAPRYAAGDDAVLVGHVHDPLHLRDGQGRDFLIIGDWLEHFTWVRLEEGRFTLEQLSDPEIREIPPADWPPEFAPDLERASGGGA